MIRGVAQEVAVGRRQIGKLEELLARRRRQDVEVGVARNGAMRTLGECGPAGIVEREVEVGIEARLEPWLLSLSGAFSMALPRGWILSFLQA
jgi:hypothetical protein